MRPHNLVKLLVKMRVGTKGNFFYLNQLLLNVKEFSIYMK